jgi:putative oxygen-independent coproporphyrinogen III oxidase
MALITPPLALYLHFPWCVRKCPYCDFNSHTLHGELPQEAYLEALLEDLDAQLPRVSGRTVGSVFLGGGTPSLFEPAALARLLEALRSRRLLAPSAEITLEANPGTIERGRFADYRAAGINRVSLGAQSFSPPMLERLGRIHSVQDTRAAAEELHAAGLSNFNLDLMYALPDQDLAGAVADVRAALALAPAHVSHYQLTLEPGTVFGGRPPPGLPDEELSFTMQQLCQAELATAGFMQYEVSAYARAGAQCSHNLNYWNFGDYLGAGAGAHGKLTHRSHGLITRSVREREPRRYLAGGCRGEAVTNVVASADLPFEFMMNALRLNDGFEPAQFETRTGLDWPLIAPTVQRHTARGLLASEGGRWRATELGRRFLNDLIVDFLPAPRSGAARSPGPARQKNPEGSVV